MRPRTDDERAAFNDGLEAGKRLQRDAYQADFADAMKRLADMTSRRDAAVQVLEGNLIVLGNLGGNATEEHPTARQELIRKAWLDTRAALTACGAKS